MALTLYHIAPSRSSIVRWMLEEIGEPYDLHVLSMAREENRAPAYLDVNPMGKVPALVHDGVVITEVAAICCYLADAFPQAGLGVPIGDPRRGPYLKWLFFSSGCIEPAVLDRAFPRAAAPPRGTLGYGDFDTVMDVLAAAVSPGPYLLGDTFTAADIVVGAQLRWALLFKLIPQRPEFLEYVGRLDARPALQRVTRMDHELGKTQAG